MKDAPGRTINAPGGLVEVPPWNFNDNEEGWEWEGVLMRLNLERREYDSMAEGAAHRTS
jgi:hypothetical protein